MFANLVEMMRDELRIKRTDEYTKEVRMPSWVA
jgi:hypothetical protein